MLLFTHSSLYNKKTMNFHTNFGNLIFGIILTTFLFNLTSCSEPKKEEKIITTKLSQEDAMKQK